MPVAFPSSPTRIYPSVGLFVLATAAAIAVLSSLPYAGSWNDGSRLATVESLVDYHTLAIDRSIFLQVPPGIDPSPYPTDDLLLQLYGTGDRLFIQGHYYSDKSPTPALLMAGFYQVWQWCTGLNAREFPDQFCYWMTVGSSGLAYVVAVWCIFQLGGSVGLAMIHRLAITASFGLSTVALTYVRHVNNHILLLGVAALLLLGLVRLVDVNRDRRMYPWRLLGLGTLAGFAYTIDLGAGPVLLLCSLALVAYRCRQAGQVSLFLLAALPWLVLHHAVNYSVGGTFKPANAVPEYFQWPGSGFNSQNLTGSWNHESLGSFLTYAAALLVGKRGFLGHDLPLYLALPALAILLLRGARVRYGSGTRFQSCQGSDDTIGIVSHNEGAQGYSATHLPELLYAGCCMGGIWLLYALTSNNYSGMCCSIRWFVPVLAPAYFVLAVLLREDGRFAWIFFTLSGWGAALAGMMWYVGPWTGHLVPFFWPVQGAALMTLILIGAWRWRRGSRSALTHTKEQMSPMKAA